VSVYLLLVVLCQLFTFRLFSIINRLLVLTVLLLRILMSLFYFTCLFFFVLLEGLSSYQTQLMIHIEFDKIE